MAEVLLKHVNKYFGDKQILFDINLEVNDGEFLVLVGPSGCGKSTTLRLIAGLEEVDEGELYIGGKLMNNVEPKDRNIAMVFQNYALYPHMNVFENMAFGLKLRKFPKDEIRRRVQEAAAILGIEDLLQRRPKELSGGQRQRVAVGRAIVRQPQVFLFDEPLSNLDAKLRVQMRAELKRLHQRLKTTMIYVTHDQVEAMTMGDRIVVLKEGRIMQVDEPLRLYRHPANRYVAGFIGSPPMNFISVEIISSERLQGPDFSLEVPKSYRDLLGRYKGTRVFLGVRPEHIRLVPDGEGIPATLEVTELMGSEALAHLKIGAEPAVARLKPGNLPPAGSPVKLILDAEEWHFFHPETGKRLEVS